MVFLRLILYYLGRIPGARWKCQICNSMQTNLPRHVRLKHGWSWERAKKVNSIFENRSCTWLKGHPPTRKKKAATVGKGKGESVDKETTGAVESENVKPKQDYHHKRICPIENCHAVVKRMCKHLQTHGFKPDTEEYKHYCNIAQSFKHSNHIKEMREKRHEEQKINSVREFMDNDNTLVDFCAKKTKPLYIPPFKAFHDIISVDENALKKDVYEASHASTENREVLTTNKILNRFQNYMASVDGGKRNGKKTVPQYRQMVQTVVNVLSSGGENDLSVVCPRMSVRDKFLW